MYFYTMPEQCQEPKKWAQRERSLCCKRVRLETFAESIDVQCLHLCAPDLCSCGCLESLVDWLWLATRSWSKVYILTEDLQLVLCFFDFVEFSFDCCLARLLSCNPVG